MIYIQLLPLLKWRKRVLHRELTAKAFADWLSVEGMATARMPHRFERALTGFRKLSQPNRVAVARRFLGGGR